MSNVELRIQARLVAIQDFSKTELYKMDSVFYVSFHDTVYKIESQKISENNYKSVRGKAYPDIIAVSILGQENKIFLDTTMSINEQPAIPSRIVEQNGKLFIWRDKHYPLTDSIIKIFDKHHLIKRGKGYDWIKIEGGIDDAKQATDYYFCRNDLSVYRKKITNVAMGYYEPPKLNCR